MMIARATEPIATNISRKISSRHPARNPLGPIISAGRPILLLPKDFRMDLLFEPV
jgi:hypothetical protein